MSALYFRSCATCDGTGQVGHAQPCGTCQGSGITRVPLGAQIDVSSSIANALDELDRECKCAAVRGDDVTRVGLAVLHKHFAPALLLMQSEFAPLTNSALRKEIALLIAERTVQPDIPT